MKYRIAKWSDYQHYRDRNPPWIKLHFSLLSSPEWVVASDAERVLLVACMLLASRTDGEIDASGRGLAYLQRVAYLREIPDLSLLVESGFLVPADADASTMLADASGLLADASTTQARCKPMLDQRRDRDREETDINAETERPRSRAHEAADSAPRLSAERPSAGTSSAEAASRTRMKTAGNGPSLACAGISPPDPGRGPGNGQKTPPGPNAPPKRGGAPTAVGALLRDAIPERPDPAPGGAAAGLYERQLFARIRRITKDGPEWLDWWTCVIGKLGPAGGLGELESLIGYAEDCGSEAVREAKGLGPLKQPGGYLVSRILAWARRNGVALPDTPKQLRERSGT